MARSKAAKEKADKERKEIRAKLKTKAAGSNAAFSSSASSSGAGSPDIGLPEERAKDSSKQKLTAAFRKEGWKTEDDNSVIIACAPNGADYKAVAKRAEEIVKELGYNESWGVRSGSFESDSSRHGRKKTAEEAEDDTEEEVEIEEEDEVTDQDDTEE